MSSRRAAGAAWVLGGFLFSGTLHAEPRPAVRLSYSRDAGASACPDELALRKAVTRRLGYDPFDGAAAAGIAARVTKSGGVLRGEVTATDAAGKVTGVRKLSAEGGDCAELVASMALAVSIAVDPEAALRGPAPLPAPPPPAPPPPAPPGPPPAAREPSPPTRATPSRRPDVGTAPVGPISPATPRYGIPRFHLGLGGLASSGPAPGPSGGVTLDGGYRAGSWSGSLEARFDFPTSASLGSSGASVSAYHFTMTAVPCLHAGPIAGCALASLGLLHGSGAGVSGATSEITPFAALGVRLFAEVPVAARFSVVGHLDAAATLTRTTLELGATEAFTTPRAMVSGGAGVRLRFP